MTYRTCFATAFYHTDGYAPNLGRIANINKFAAYYRCMVVAFATIRKHYDEANLILFTNRPIKANYQAKLDNLGVKTIIISKENTHYVSDYCISNSFPGCLFTLDVIEYTAMHGLGNEIDSIFLFDSDCIVLNNFNRIIEQVALHDRIVGLQLNYDLSHEVNRQSRASLTNIFNKLADLSGTASIDAINYYGGEFYGFSIRTLPIISASIARYWKFIKLNLAEFGKDFTEEHILSMVFNEMRESFHHSPNLIKRTWTADSFQNIDGSESQYSILHLPAEKRKLFQDLYRLIEKDQSGFLKMSDDEIKGLVKLRFETVLTPTSCHRLLSITKNTLRKLVIKST